MKSSRAAPPELTAIELVWEQAAIVEGWQFRDVPAELVAKVEKVCEGMPFEAAGRLREIRREMNRQAYLEEKKGAAFLEQSASSYLLDKNTEYDAELVRKRRSTLRIVARDLAIALVSGGAGAMFAPEVIGSVAKWATGVSTWVAHVQAILS